MCWCGVYALGDGITPFRVSMVSIFLNAVLAYVFCTNFRRTGFSSGNRGVNLVSMSFVILAAGSQATVCPGSIGLCIFGLTGGSFVAGLASWGISGAVNKFGVEVVRAATTTKFFWACWHRRLCPDYRSDEITRG